MVRLAGLISLAATATLAQPIAALRVAMFGVRTEGAMAPEIPLERQRPAQYVFSRHVQEMLTHLGKPEVRAKKTATRN